LIPAPPAFLFSLWTEPAQLLQWWAPEGYEPSLDSFDARPGGRWRIVLRRPDGTRLVLLHQHFKSTQTLDRHGIGWRSCFDRLTKIANSREEG